MSVRVEDPDPGAAIEVGLKTAVAPEGSPDAVRAMAELKPPEMDVVMLLVPDSHQVSAQDGLATVRPSISVCDTPCKSHYVISRGGVEWLPAFSALRRRPRAQSDRASCRSRRAAAAVDQPCLDRDRKGVRQAHGSASVVAAICVGARVRLPP